METVIFALFPHDAARSARPVGVEPELLACCDVRSHARAAFHVLQRQLEDSAV